MSENIQNLLDKINAEGIEKAEAEKAAIIKDAEAQAAKIIADAKAQAEEYTRKAAESAAAGEARANAAIKQAARDIVIALKSDLLKKLNAAVKECAASSMTPDRMGDIILEMVKAYASGPDKEELEVLLPQKEAANADAILRKVMLAGLKAKPVLNFTDDFNAGLQISFKGDDVFFDFTDEALAEILCRFAGPKLAAIIKD